MNPRRHRAQFQWRRQSRVERKLVSRHVKHTGISIEDFLRPVAVMNVDIDDGNPLEAACQHAGRRNRDIVEKTEAHRSIGFSVVSRRMHQSECRLSLGDGVFGRLYHCARGEQRDVERLGRRERVRSNMTALPAVDTIRSTCRVV